MGDSIDTDSLATHVPQSAQAAHQQARIVTANILHSAEDRELEEFHYADLGEMMPVGGRRAIARILGFPLDGYGAWALEKALFVLRIPGVENKLKLFNEIAIEPLVKKGEEFLEARQS
jgi:NADH dehydrogenase